MSVTADEKTRFSASITLQQCEPDPVKDLEYVGLFGADMADLLGMDISNNVNITTQREYNFMSIESKDIKVTANFYIDAPREDSVLLIESSYPLDFDEIAFYTMNYFGASDYHVTEL